MGRFSWKEAQMREALLFSVSFTDARYLRACVARVASTLLLTIRCGIDHVCSIVASEFVTWIRVIFN